ncbi:hypothetical protein V8E36_001042 [Tilletia maclaganii]
MSFSLPVRSVEGLKDEVELLKNSCADGEFRAGQDGSADFDLVLSFEPQVLLRCQCPSLQDANAANVSLTLSGPSANPSAILRLQKLVESRLQEDDFDEAEYKIYDIFTFLQSADVGTLSVHGESVESTVNAGQDGDAATALPAFKPCVQMARCIFWSHHLKSTTKKKNIRAWCSELRVWGITRPNYPAFLLFEGTEEDIDIMIHRAKDQNWHALSVRAHVKYTFQRPDRPLDENVSSEDMALLNCLLAKGHACSVVDLNNSATDDTPSTLGSPSKIRPGVEEIEAISDLVHRLRAAGVPELEYTEALGLRT